MNTATRRTAAFAEMRHAMQTAAGAVADGAGRRLYGG
ncbi:hypothetical protein J2753_000126 [Halolamina salifodinae]|uniref:Uncharacterized protein n=1 Tax=Halolamina salifodinae TaxID=1202767 RepID=A0A8T4GU94_9EURY|nr:hypothetical protein [Halolamina salifodinae]